MRVSGTVKGSSNDGDGFRRMVLRSMPLPAWLDGPGTADDVVVSTRCRFMRNLRGHRFPSTASPGELLEIANQVRSAACEPKSEDADLRFRSVPALGKADFDHLVRFRLASPHFPFIEPGRAILVNDSRSASVMVNEEDHIRLQVLLPGFSVGTAVERGRKILAFLESRLEFAKAESLGYVAACPLNSGEGQRLSIMCHLIGLAHHRKLAQTLSALRHRGLVVRGLFGESSRGIGAFIQLSKVSGNPPEWNAACELLITDERNARLACTPKELQDGLAKAISFCIRSRSVTAVEALRVLGWMRWGVVSGLLEAGSPRSVDLALAAMESSGSNDDTRANTLRLFAESLSSR